MVNEKNPKLSLFNPAIVDTVIPVYLYSTRQGVDPMQHGKRVVWLVCGYFDLDVSFHKRADWLSAVMYSCTVHLPEVEGCYTLLQN